MASSIPTSKWQAAVRKPDNPPASPTLDGWCNRKYDIRATCSIALSSSARMSVVWLGADQVRMAGRCWPKRTSCRSFKVEHFTPSKADLSDLCNRVRDF